MTITKRSDGYFDVNMGRKANNGLFLTDRYYLSGNELRHLGGPIHIAGTISLSPVILSIVTSLYAGESTELFAAPEFDRINHGPFEHPVRSRLTCCCCGESAGTWEQWHNRDTGYGLCKRCADWIKTRRPFGQEPITNDEFHRLYGIEGVNWGK